MEAKRIVLEMENGYTKEVTKGMVAQLEDNKLDIDFVNTSKIDVLRFAKGMLMAVEKFGMMDLFMDYIDGELPDE